VSVAALWERARAVLEAEAPEASKALRPPVSDEALAALESALPAGALDPAWVALLRIHDGQETTSAPGVFFGFWFLSAAACLAEWRRWEELRKGSTPEQLHELGSLCKSLPPGAIARMYTNAGWIPVFQEPHEGNFLGIDVAPGPNGRAGQIIPFGRDEDTKRVVAPDFEALLRWYVQELEAGALEVERDGGDVFVSHEGNRVVAVLMKRAKGG
jgi:cell wall assembly regulator SMI1